MNVTPFLGFFYKGELLPINDEKTCKETGGDCQKFVTKYLKIEWFTEEVPISGYKDAQINKFESHPCSKKEVTEGIYKSGLLYLCAP